MCIRDRFTPDFKIVKAKYDKYKQINRFIELVDDAFRAYGRDEITILDFGCGKSYLTFVLYYYFAVKRGVRAKIIGYDLKEDVVEHCNEVAARYGYTDLHFVVADVTRDVLYDEHIDMLESVTWTSTEGEQPSITFTYAYDAQDRLVSASHALSGSSAYTETFTYSDAGLSSIRNPDNRVYALTYDDAGRLTGLSYPGGQESAGFVYGTNTTAVQTRIGTDAAYTVATYTYAPATGVVTRCEDADGHAVNYAYTADLLLSSVSYTNLVEGVLDETPIVQSYTYDAATRDLTRVAVTQWETLLGETLYQNYQYNQPKTVTVSYTHLTLPTKA